MIVKKGVSSSSSKSKGKSKARFDIDSYVKVNERIEEFYEKYPDGILYTKRIKEDDGVAFETCIFRDQQDAEFYASTGIAKSNGFSFLPETARGTDKVEEKAETVSVGRALAKFGLSIEKSIASSEEMEQFEDVHKSSAPLTKKESKQDAEMIEEEEEKELPNLSSPRKFKNSGSKFVANTK